MSIHNRNYSLQRSSGPNEGVSSSAAIGQLELITCK